MDAVAQLGESAAECGTHLGTRQSELVLDVAHRARWEPVEPEAGQHDLQFERIEIVEQDEGGPRAGSRGRRPRPPRCPAGSSIKSMSASASGYGQPSSLGHESSVIQDSEPAMACCRARVAASSTAVFRHPTLDEWNLCREVFFQCRPRSPARLGRPTRRARIDTSPVPRRIVPAPSLDASNRYGTRALESIGVVVGHPSGT